MELSIIKIGNSKGIRLSKSILKQLGIKDRVELIVKNDQLIIKPISKVRDGWEDQFKQMAELNDDQLLVPDVFDDETIEKW
ncbi:MAG: AbrB/MazE/SpoVT family DNA-binding domain-containing protein [Flavobacteriaceae bacterium]|nr:AbrB/MazE/SpoVT family DNA-binding domain-containing protein [Flavobacteriaceae bacterium]NVJ72870.1 AbrB/MazE/SpoVT family DNA-binding domain-containing protein [Flavobacteriaceae bacterium]